MTIPFSRVIWSAEQCAEYLGQSYSTFIKRTQYREGFPARCPIPGQPRWSASKVADWAQGVETIDESRQKSANEITAANNQ